MNWLALLAGAIFLLCAFFAYCFIVGATRKAKKHTHCWVSYESIGERYCIDCKKTERTK